MANGSGAEQPMQLSIVIVNWNTRDMLRACLESVYQGLKDVAGEVIVVDNGSTDGSAEMVSQEFGDTILILNPDNRGFAAANNQALGVAAGNYILLLNSDTVVHGAVLERSVAYMDQHPDVGAMGCRVLNSDGTLQPTCSRYPTLTNLVLLSSGLWKLPWPAAFDRYQMRRWPRTDERDVEVVSGCYLMVRANVIEQVGMMDESFFFFGEETDWCRRILALGWKLRFAPVGEITHHGGGSSASLSFRRDVLLAHAIVRLHLKHSGALSALVAWCIVFGFNLSRALFWTAACGIAEGARRRERRDHFVSLVRNQHRLWPTNGAFPLEQ